MNWGAHKTDVRIAAKNSVTIRAALRTSINARAIYDAYQDTHPFVSDNITQDRTRARAWAILHVKIDPEPIQAALKKVYTDGFLLGLDASYEAMNQAVREQRLAHSKTAKDELLAQGGNSESVDWDSWTPGHRAAALLYQPAGAFKKLLDNAGIVSKKIAANGYDKIGTALADSIAAGFSWQRTAEVINEKIGDPTRALTIAVTEQNRAMSLASMENYDKYGIEKVEWSGAMPCDICAPNEGQIVETGQPFNSGDTEPPVHPNCRCALLPVIDEAFYAEPNTNGIDDIMPAEEAPPEQAVPNQAETAQSFTISDTDALHAQMTYQRDAGFYDNKQITGAQSGALTAYTSNSYQKIQSVLRTGRAEPGPIDHEQVAKIKKTAEDLESLIKAAPALPKEIITYRGITGDIAKEFAELKPGSVITDKGFTSTSYLREKAEIYAAGEHNTEANGNHLLMEVINPAGTQGVNVEAFFNNIKPSDKLFEQNAPSTTATQYEWLLSKDSKFEVISNDGKILKVKVVTKTAEPLAQPAPTAVAENIQMTEEQVIGYQREQGFSKDTVLPIQAKALKAYQGADYSAINENLRTGAVFSGGVPAPTLKKYIWEISTAIEAAPVLPTPITVYRGVSGNYSQVLAKYQPGTIYQDKGFTSTTLSAKQADFFAKYRNAKEYLKIEIEVPAGSKGIDMEGFFNEKDPKTGKIKFNGEGEKEWLLPKNSKFEVISNDGITMKVRLINKTVEPAPKPIPKPEPVPTPEPAPTPVVEPVKPKPATRLTNDQLKDLGKKQITELEDTPGSGSSNLLETNREALDTYKGAYYQTINEFLRNGKTRYNLSTADIADLKRDVEKIQETIEATSPLKENKITLRGIHGKFADELWNKKIGSTYEDKGFCSTTSNPDAALTFGGKTQLEILNPIGTKGLALDGVLATKGIHEHEWLLPKGTKFEIISKTEATDKTNYIRIIRLKAISPFAPKPAPTAKPAPKQENNNKDLAYPDKGQEKIRLEMKHLENEIDRLGFNPYGNPSNYSEEALKIRDKINAKQAEWDKVRKDWYDAHFTVDGKGTGTDPFIVSENEVRDMYVVYDKATLAMNKSLRQGKPPSERALKVDKMVAEGKAISDTVVYRSAILPEKLHATFEEGFEYTDLGFQSTAISEKGAEAYAQIRKENGAKGDIVIMTIKIPKGATARDVGMGEVVLPRNTKMRVAKRTVAADGHIEVEMEVIP